MRYFLPIVCGVLLIACRTTKTTEPVKRPKIPYMEEGPASAPLSDGSLWQDRRVVSDLRANRLNDLVTIRIVESTNAISKADVTTGKNGTSSLDTSSATTDKSDKSATTPAAGKSDKTDASSAAATPAKGNTVSSKFTGSGTTGRSAVFTTTITARVVKVLGNGNLIFEGLRDIQLNNETQRLYVAGMVDPARLDAANSISSALVAELRVGYGGRGIVEENLKPGYISRLLNYIWPF